MRNFMSVLWLAGLACAQTNLISNPGFEIGLTGLSGWYTQANAPAVPADLDFSKTSDAHSGSGAAQVDVYTAYSAATNWYLQFALPRWEVTPNTSYKISFWAKGPGSIHCGFTDVPDNYKYIGGFQANLTSEWKQYTGELVTTTQTGKTVQVGLYLGATTGTYLFDDFSVTEQGRLDTAWFGKHQSRIDSARKKSFSVVIKDSNGNPVPSAAVRLKLARHSFPFGTALSFASTNRPSGDELWYRQTAASLFNYAVFENDFKWPGFESIQGIPDTAKIATYLHWGDSLNIPIRGHALVWAIQNYGYDKFWGTDTSKLTCNQIAANIKAHILRDVAYYKGRLKEYDVWNEAIHEQAFFAKCKDEPRFAPDGWALQDSAFVWARAADPTAKLYINDYNNVDGGDNEAYYEEIAAMQKRGTPVDGIGIQCHFGGQNVDPTTVASRLDRLAQLGLPIKVTEFDNEKMSGSAAFTPTQQAAQFNRFIRTMYSHPAVTGIVFWGFWDERQWLPQMNPGVSAGIYTSAKVAKPAVDSIKYLWNSLWTTDTQLVSNPNGAGTWRGFPGRYEATVEQGGKTWIVPVDLSNSNQATIVLTGEGATGTKPGSPAPRSLRLRAGRGEVSFFRQTDGEAWTVSLFGFDGSLKGRSVLAEGQLEGHVPAIPGTYLVVARSRTATVLQLSAVVR